jgi:CheY-like chemotaxis protein
LRVLIIDDSEDDATLLLRQLRKCGWDPQHVRVDTAAAMATALDNAAWDVVISDLSMPLFGGFEALALFSTRGIGIPFILLSGMVNDETATAAIKAGASDCLCKQDLKKVGLSVDHHIREFSRRAQPGRLSCLAAMDGFAH